MDDLSINVADRVGVFSDIDLAARLTDTEDHFTERKSKSDKSGWLKTTVAFANSTPIGYPALLFVGVTDDGTITDNGKIEDLMKSYSDSIASNCYPPIYTMPRVFTHNGKSCIAVIVPGSEARPHFAGLSYVRDGTQNRNASEQQYRQLISERLSKVRELRQWIGKTITFETVQGRGIVATPIRGSSFPIIADCNQFYVTITHTDFKRAIPLERLSISRDLDRDRLKLEYEE